MVKFDDCGAGGRVAATVGGVVGEGSVVGVAVAVGEGALVAVGGGCVGDGAKEGDGTGLCAAEVGCAVGTAVFELPPQARIATAKAASATFRPNLLPGTEQV